jgi:NodT family efflux transporter outer membrane factor (OMF) lipoprotein
VRGPVIAVIAGIAFTAALGVLAGCAVGPDYHPPKPIEGAEGPLVSTSPTAETTREPPDAWWELYRDETLDRFLKEAFAANTDLKIAAANLTASRAVLQAARAGRYPQTLANVGATYGRDAGTDEILEIVGHAPESIWVYDTILDVSYEIDLFGRVRRSIEAATADAATVAAARDVVKITVAAETARAYGQICALGEQINVAHHSLDVVSHELEITTNREQAGAGSQFDVVRAQELVAQVRASIPPLEGQRRAALFQLAALLGRPPSKAPVEAEKCVLPPGVSDLIPVGDGTMLLKRRPDVREAEQRLAAATARIGVSTADLYPQIELKGLIGGVSSELNELTTNKGITWGVGPSISWAFPNQAVPRARVRQAKANAAAALAGFDGVVLQALRETEQALTTYRSELDRRQALSEAQERARKAFSMAHDQFLAGSVSNLDLLTSEQTLICADAAVAASDSALIQDQIGLFKALGGGWRNTETAAQR